MKVCSVEGCDRKVKTRGFCGMHYKRFMKTGDPGEVEPRRGGKECSVDGCNKEYVASGYCGMHYQRWRSTGKPGEATPKRIADQGDCQIDRCEQKARARFRCEKHLKRVYDFGEDGISRIYERDQLRNPEKPPPNELATRQSVRSIDANKTLQHVFFAKGNSIDFTTSGKMESLAYSRETSYTF